MYFNNILNNPIWKTSYLKKLDPVVNGRRRTQMPAHAAVPKVPNPLKVEMCLKQLTCLKNISFRNRFGSNFEQIWARKRANNDGTRHGPQTDPKSDRKRRSSMQAVNGKRADKHSDLFACLLPAADCTCLSRVAWPGYWCQEPSGRMGSFTRERFRCSLFEISTKNNEC